MFGEDYFDQFRVRFSLKKNKKYFALTSETFINLNMNRYLESKQLKIRVAKKDDDYQVFTVKGMEGPANQGKQQIFSRTIPEEFRDDIQLN